MDKPSNPFVTALLTDFYEDTTVYAYWKDGKHNEDANFDLFFRECPFGGEFAIFAGLNEALRFIMNFGFSESDIEYLQSQLPNCEPEFFDWLSKLDSRHITIRAIHEGSIVFPRVPLLSGSGPLGVIQLLETTLLNLINYPTLIATNAARFRLLAPNMTLIDMGLRRAQGPDGALSGAKYSYLGGFDSTSNVLAGKMFGIPIKGTHPHSFVTSYSADELKNDQFSRRAIEYRNKICEILNLSGTNDGELASFISFAKAFPDNFLSLVDTYNTMKSGIPNFMAVALVLAEDGHKPVGIRLDSGDLAFLSKEARKIFHKVAGHFNISLFNATDLLIAASNDINEQSLSAMQEQGNELNILGIGTHMITCQKQPALGGVYKLVAIKGKSRIKISENIIKIPLPGRKAGYRLYGNDGSPILDLLIRDGEEPAPIPGEKILCCHPFDTHKRVYVTPRKVRCLHFPYIVNGIPSAECETTLEECRSRAKEELANLRDDHKRLTNPTPYKVSVSEKLFTELHNLWSSEAPIEELN